MTKIETAIDDWYRGNDAILTIQERCALTEVIERLIDERTEQCAKICDEVEAEEEKHSLDIDCGQTDC